MQLVVLISLDRNNTAWIAMGQLQLNISYSNAPSVLTQAFLLFMYIFTFVS